MTVISAEQAAVSAAKAGFTGNGLTTIVAISGAESGYDTNSHNSTPPDDSYGLTQINMIGSMGPERRAKYGLAANTDLYNPDTNYRVAYDLSSHGTDFSAWTTYTSGAYKKFQTTANNAVASQTFIDLFGKGITAGATGIGAGLESTGGLISQAGNFLSWISTPKNWLRIAEILLGAGLVIAGLNVVAKPLTQPLVSDLKSMGGAVKKGASWFPAGKVASVATKAATTAKTAATETAKNVKG